MLFIDYISWGRKDRYIKLWFVWICSHDGKRQKTNYCDPYVGPFGDGELMDIERTTTRKREPLYCQSLLQWINESMLLIEFTNLEISYDIVVMKNIDYYHEQVREKIKSSGVLIHFFENRY